MSETAALPSAGYRRNVYFCSFCERSLAEVEFMVVGARAGICGDCVEAACEKVVAGRAEKAKPVTVAE